MAEMTPLEAAETLEDIAAVSDLKAVDGARSGLVNLSKNDASSLRVIASMLRKISAGEYKQVVHGHWIDRTERHGKVCFECSSCGAQNSGGIDLYCYACGAFMYAPVMRQTQAGKDDSHE